MLRIGKKIVSILLTILMAFSVFAIVPFTASAFENVKHVEELPYLDSDRYIGNLRFTAGTEYKPLKSHDKLTLSGTLQKEDYVMNNGSKGSVSILNLDIPFYCYLSDGFNYNGEKLYYIDSVQCNLSNAQKYYGNKVTITGNTLFSHTIHHRRDIVLLDCVVMPYIDPYPPTVDGGKLGDVDGDGKVTVIDATEIQRYKAEIISEDMLDLTVADVDEDGKITVLDATRIQRYKAELCNLDGSIPYIEA